MYKDLLPIGSIVQLRDMERRVMICGRVVCRSGEDKIYDYIACVYPEGIMGGEELTFFDRDAIEGVFFIGSQDQDELTFRQEVLGKLGELTVVNGEIRQKEQTQ